MNLADILEISAIGGGGTVILILSLIQISPLKVNPWTAIGKALTRGIKDDVRDMNEKLEEAVAHKLDNQEDMIDKKLEDLRASGDKRAEKTQSIIDKVEGKLLDRMEENREESNFRDDKTKANNIRITIMTVVNSMKNNVYPVNDELATEYYRMCNWYIRFCEHHHEGENKFVYENDKMVKSCEQYMEWYEDKYINLKED